MKPFFAIVALTVVLCACIFPEASDAQSRKIPVAVVHSGTDTVGVGIAFNLKEAIRSSQSFVLVNPEPVPSSPRIVIRLTSISVQDHENIHSAITTVMLYDSLAMPASGAYLSSLVQVCGRDRIEQCARSILPEIDTETEALRRNWPELWKTL